MMNQKTINNKKDSIKQYFLPFINAVDNTGETDILIESFCRVYPHDNTSQYFYENMTTAMTNFLLDSIMQPFRGGSRLDYMNMYTLFMQCKDSFNKQ